MPDELLTKVDNFCMDNDYNRSEFIRYALRVVIRKYKRQAKKDVEK